MNSNNDPSIEEVLQEKDSEKQKQKYNDYVSNITEKQSFLKLCQGVSGGRRDLCRGRRL